MPQFYGSQRLFWYLIVAVTLNSASIAVLTYFLYMRAKAGSTAVYHFLGLFERCLPAWWKEKRLAAERESVAQLVTSAIALGYLLHSLTLISGPALFDDNDPSVRKGGVPSTWPCSVVGASAFSVSGCWCWVDSGNRRWNANTRARGRDGFLLPLRLHRHYLLCMGIARDAERGVRAADAGGRRQAAA